MHSIKQDMQNVEEEEQTKYNTESSLGVDRKLHYSGKCIHTKLVKSAARSTRRNTNVPITTATTEKRNPTNTTLSVLHVIETETSDKQRLIDTLSKPLNPPTKLLPDTRQKFQSTISETIVLYLNKTENSNENGFSALLSEVSEIELPSITRPNSFDSCITSVKEKIGSSSGDLDNVQLFLHALLSFAEKAYPQVVQQLNKHKSQEMYFTFTCDLKSDDVNLPASQLDCTTSPKTRTSVVEMVKMLPERLDTDFLKFKLTPLYNQIHLKLSLDKFLQNVMSLLPVVNDMCSNSAIKVPTLHFANWHFRNIAQGYLLRFVLNKSNVNTLNVMRNLYFIIITTNTVNLFLEVHFNLKNDIFTLEDIINPVKDSCEGTTIQGSISVSSFGSDTFVNDFGVFGGADIYKNEPNIFVDSGGEDTLSMSAFDSILSTATSRCTIVTGKQCAAIATSTIFSFHHPPNPKQTIDKGAGDEPAFSVHEKPKPKGWLFKPWVTKTKKYTVPTHNMELPLNYFDETIFERLSYLHNKCISPEFRKVFFKSLGHTLGCTLLSLLISLL